MKTDFVFKWTLLLTVKTAKCYSHWRLIKISSLLKGIQIFIYSLIDIYMLTINDTWVFLWRGGGWNVILWLVYSDIVHIFYLQSLIALFLFTMLHLNLLVMWTSLCARLNWSWPQNQRAMFDLTWPFQLKMFLVHHVLLWKTVKSSDGGCKFLIPGPTLSTTVHPYNFGFTKAVSHARGQEVMKLILYLVSL